MKKHEIFKANPHLKEVHQTSDGELFYNDGDAKMHAKTLKNKKVEPILNPDHLVASDEQTEDDGTKVIDLTKMKKAELIAFAKENELDLDEKLTNAQMVELISTKLGEALSVEKTSEGIKTENQA